MCFNSRDIRLITFDAMKTLIKLKQPVGKTYSEFARRKNFRLSLDDPNRLDDAFLRTYRRLDGERPCFGFVDNVKSIDRQRTWWMDLVKRTISESIDREIGDDDDASLDELARDLYDYFGTTEPWLLDSSTKNVLDFLTRKGISVAILSNFDSRLRSIIADFGLATYFRGAFFLSGETGLAKPSTDAFRLIERTMHLRSNECAHVGDDLLKDYAAAKSAGWKGFLVESDQCRDERVDMRDVIRDLNDLKSKIS